MFFLSGVEYHKQAPTPLPASAEALCGGEEPRPERDAVAHFVACFPGGYQRVLHYVVGLVGAAGYAQHKAPQGPLLRC
jgi:hypothetical protein